MDPRRSRAKNYDQLLDRLRERLRGVPRDRESTRAALDATGLEGVVHQHTPSAGALRVMTTELRRLIGLTDDLACRAVLEGVLACVRDLRARHSISVNDIPADLPRAAFVHNMHVSRDGTFEHRISMAICPGATGEPGDQVITRYRLAGHDICVDQLRLPDGSECTAASVWTLAAAL